MKPTLNSFKAGTALKEALVPLRQRLIAAQNNLQGCPAVVTGLFSAAVFGHIEVEPGERGVKRIGKLIYIDGNLLNALNEAALAEKITNEEANVAVAYIICHCFGHAATKTTERADRRSLSLAPDLVEGAYDAEVAILLSDFQVELPSPATRAILATYGINPPKPVDIDAVRGKTARDLINTGTVFPRFGDVDATVETIPQRVDSDPHSYVYRDIDLDEISVEVYDALEMSLSFGVGFSSSHRLFYFLTHSLVDPETMLRGFLQDTTAAQLDYQCYNPRKFDEGLAVPKTVKLDSEKNKGYGAMCIDTSGSIPVEMISRFATIIRDFLEAQNLELELDVYFGDDGISEPLTVRSKEIDIIQKEFRPHGGGGTDFRPFFEAVKRRAEAEGRAPQFLIYCTDLCGTFPAEDPGIPTLWLTSTNSGIIPKAGEPAVPFGKVAYLGAGLL